MISLDQCLAGNLYRIKSRNLDYGVFDGKTGFIGIRTKLGARYLFTEYHWEQGPPYGTVQPQEDLGRIPEGIKLKEGWPIGDQQWEQNDPLFRYLDDFEEVVSKGG